MPKHITMLTDTDTHEVSVVDRGANRRIFALTKSKGNLMEVLEAVLATPVENEDQLREVAKAAGLSDKGIEAAVGMHRLMKGFSEELTTEGVAAIVKSAGFEAVQPEPVVEPEAPAPVAVVKAEDVPEEFRAIFKAQTEKTEALEAQNLEITKELLIIKEAGESKRFVEKAADFDKVAPADELGALLKDISDQSPELCERVEAVLKSSQERIATGKLFGKIGSDKSEIVNPMGQLKAIAKKMVADGEATTQSDALALAMSQNPELVKATREEA